jgi:fructose/tagatose bisphosphate aldolase
VVRAAEAKRSPAQILLFPWALHYSPLLIHLAAAACATAKVPIALHMDHAQSEEEIMQVSYAFNGKTDRTVLLLTVQRRPSIPLTA